MIAVTGLAHRHFRMPVDPSPIICFVGDERICKLDIGLRTTILPSIRSIWTYMTGSYFAEMVLMTTRKLLSRPFTSSGLVAFTYFVAPIFIAACHFSSVTSKTVTLAFNVTA